MVYFVAIKLGPLVIETGTMKLITREEVPTYSNVGVSLQYSFAIPFLLSLTQIILLAHV